MSPSLPVEKVLAQYAESKAVEGGDKCQEILTVKMLMV